MPNNCVLTLHCWLKIDIHTGLPISSARWVGSGAAFSAAMSMCIPQVCHPSCLAVISHGGHVHLMSRGTNESEKINKSFTEQFRDDPNGICCKPYLFKHLMQISEGSTPVRTTSLLSKLRHFASSASVLWAVSF